jgi:hypothetical protein
VPQLLVLHLQLDLVNLQFVQELLLDIPGSRRGGRFFAQSLFRAAAQLVWFKRTFFQVHASLPPAENPRQCPFP